MAVRAVAGMLGLFTGFILGIIFTYTLGKNKMEYKEDIIKRKYYRKAVLDYWDLIADAMLDKFIDSEGKDFGLDPEELAEFRDFLSSDDRLESI